MLTLQFSRKNFFKQKNCLSPYQNVLSPLRWKSVHRGNLWRKHPDSGCKTLTARKTSLVNHIKHSEKYLAFVFSLHFPNPAYCWKKTRFITSSQKRQCAQSFLGKNLGRSQVLVQTDNQRQTELTTAHAKTIKINRQKNFRSKN